MIVNYPAKIKSNQTSKAAFTFWDVLPTVCNLLNQSVPKESNGVSFLPTLLGKKQSKKHNYLYWELYEEGGKQAVLWNNWKGIRLNTNDASKTVFELYNLQTDIGEAQNIASKNPEIQSKIEKMMAEAHRPFELTSLFKNDPSAQRDVQIKK